MERIGKISTVQMFSIMFLSRIIALFTFMLPSASYLPPGDRVITSFVVMLFESIYAAVIIFSIGRTTPDSIITKTAALSGTLSKLLALIYTFVFIWFAGTGTARFELFISTVIFPNSELTLMIIVLLIAGAYASLKGIEAIGRTSVILMAVLGASILFILLSVTGEFSHTNFKPLFTQGFSPVLLFSFYVSVRAAELPSLLVSAPKIHGNIKKMIFLWIFVFSAICSIILIYLTGVTGEYGDDQIFPLYTLTVIAKFGIFERLDDILTGVWVLCSFIQLSFLLYICTLTLRQGFGKIKKIPSALLCTAGVFVVYIFTSDTVTVFSESVSSAVIDVIFIVTVIFIPLTVTFFNKRRRKS